jgi:hypothetical protein
MEDQSSKSQNEAWIIEFGLIKAAYKKILPYPIESYFTIVEDGLIFAADRKLPEQLKESITNAFNTIYYPLD